MSEYYNEPQDLPPLGGSYHYMIKWAPLPSYKVKYVIEKVSYRPLSDRGLLEFGNWITSESWDEVAILESSDEKAKFLQDKLRNKYEECFPEKTFKRCNTDRPYITQEIKDLIQYKIQLRKEGKIGNANMLRNKVRKMTRKAAAEYYHKKIDNLFESKPSMWYKEIKQICGKSPSGVDFCSDSNDETVANQLNGHLARILQSLLCLDVNKMNQEYQKIPHDGIPLPTISKNRF